MIILLGMPGAGKTTQTEMLAKYLNCPWFSMGDLLRANITGKDRQDMLAGKLIDYKVPLQIIEKALADIDTSKQEFVLEGNPRSVPQAEWWIAKIKSGQVNLTGFLHLSLDEDAAIDRLTKRGRVDDVTKEVILKRIAEYKRSVVPTVEFLKEQGYTVHEIDAAGTVEAVAGLIHKALNI
jgi:adenylate kinase